MRLLTLCFFKKKSYNNIIPSKESCERMQKEKLKITILSLSVIAVLSGAAVSPALGKIAQAFPSVDASTIKLVLTLPGLFIVLTGLIFPFASKFFNVKKLALIGLAFYVIGGTAGAFVGNIYALLFTRVLIGIGVGFIMPLSTGLLAYYFGETERKKLMGYSVAMNNLGAIIGMTVAGYMASISYQYVFLIYLLGLISIILALLYIPKDMVKTEGAAFDLKEILKAKMPILSMVLLMVAFFAYVANFAMISGNIGRLKGEAMGFIMAFQPVGALILGATFGRLDKVFGKSLKFLGPGAMILGFLLLISFDSTIPSVCALFCIGAGLGTTKSFIISDASQSVARGYVANIMAMMTIALYLGQFISPIIIGGVAKVFQVEYMKFPYIFGIGICLLIAIINGFRKPTAK